MEVWKSITEQHSREVGTLRQAAREIAETDTVKANLLMAQADSVHQAYKRRTRQLAANLKEGALHDFLKSLYPTSYPKRMPDGSVVTVYDE